MHSYELGFDHFGIGQLGLTRDEAAVIHDRCTSGIAPGACIYRGGKVSEVACVQCEKSVRIKVFACPVHGQCVIDSPRLEIKSCATCADFKAIH